MLLAVILLTLSHTAFAVSVTTILPPNGTTNGGTAVSILGAGFTGASSVSIGGVAATGVTVINDSTIDCVTGAHAAGVADVVVGSITGAGFYTYGGLPVPGGATWTDQDGAGTRTWSRITCSADGSKLAATTSGAGIWTSTNGGVNWTTSTNSPAFSLGICSSADGSKLAAAYAGIWTSTNGGATWVQHTNANFPNFLTIAASANGSRLAAAAFSLPGNASTGGNIWTSTDGGTAWMVQTNAGNHHWYSIASSADGTKLVALQVTYGADPGYPWTSVDGGVTRTVQTNAGAHNWGSVTSSGDGSKLAACYKSDSAMIMTSTNAGVSWTPHADTASNNWFSIASSADGNVIAAAVSGGDIWTSSDGGMTWTDQVASGSRYWGSLSISADGSKVAGAEYTGTDGGGGDIHTSPGIVPTATLMTGNLSKSAPSLTIFGTGFDFAIPSNNIVTLGSGAAGTVTAATATRLVVTFTTAPTSLGSLTAVVTRGSLSSGAPVQVANVVLAPLIVLPPNGSTAGGTSMTIVGSGFTGATSVSLGGVEATGVTVSMIRRLTAPRVPTRRARCRWWSAGFRAQDFTLTAHR